MHGGVRWNRFLGAGAALLGLATLSAVALPPSVAGASSDVVTNCSADPSVVGSLPYEVANASVGDTVSFASPVSALGCPLDANNIPVITVTSTIRISNNLTITGPGPSALAVSGGGGPFTVFNAGPGNIAISGLTVEDGGGGPDSLGGGIFDGTDDGLGMVTITNCTVTGNSASSGGGIFADGPLIVTNSSISNNDAHDGGGIFDSGGATTVTDSTVSGNDSQGGGGGVLVSDFGSTVASASISDTTVSGNSAGTDGGGIDNDGATTTVSSSVVTGNAATDDGGGIASSGTLDVSAATQVGSVASPNTALDGGGIEVSAGRADVTDSTVVGNQASTGGGIDDEDLNPPSTDATVYVSQSTVSSNVASGDGGGISNVDTLNVINGSFVNDNVADADGAGITNNGVMHVADSTVSGNTAPTTTETEGGGFDNRSNAMSTVTDSDISDNSAFFGGAFWNLGQLIIDDSTFSTDNGEQAIYNSDQLTVSHSTITGNTGDGIDNAYLLTIDATILNDGFPCTNTGTLDDNGYNYFAGASNCDAGNNDLSGPGAGLGPLRNNGGPTDTMALVPGMGVVTIGAIPATSNLCPGSDQRGAPVSGSSCDIGAYQSATAPFVAQVMVTASGSENADSTGLSISDDIGTTNGTPGTIPPADVTGVLQCSTVNGGTPITPSPAFGNYTIDGASCTGLASSDQTDYPLWPNSYIGAPADFIVHPLPTVTIEGYPLPPPDNAGAHVYYTVLVTGNSTDGTPNGGVVTLNDGSGPVTCQLSVAGLYSCPEYDETASYPAGTYTITASYAGDSVYAPALSAPLTVTDEANPSGNDTLTTNQVTTTATGGTSSDALTEMPYGSNPTDVGLNDGTNYFDVAVSSPSGFGNVTIKDCNNVTVPPASSPTILWWIDPDAVSPSWQEVEPSPPTYSTSPNCVTYTLNNTTSVPLISQLNGTVFGATPLPPLAVTTTSLPAGAKGQAYAGTLQATGGNPPYSWKLASGSGKLPKGLALKATGVISGKPKTSGTFHVTVEVLDKKTKKTKGHPSTQNTATQMFSIVVS